MKLVGVCFSVAVCLTVSLASQPRESLSCSDAVTDVPGISCSVWSSKQECASSPGACSGPFNGTSVDYGAASRPANFRAIDNEGGVIFLREIRNGSYGAYTLRRWELIRFEGATETIIATLTDHCTDPLCNGAHRIVPAGEQCSYGDAGLNAPIRWRYILFDEKNGRVLLPLMDCSDGPGNMVLALSGFATTFDILQTLTPQSDHGFRTPYMPDGLRAADRFDTCAGMVTRPLDLAQARPLQCGYPAAQPHVGDYEQITAAVPTPAPGHAQYELTTVTHEGQTRAGRQAIDCDRARPR